MRVEIYSWSLLDYPKSVAFLFLLCGTRLMLLPGRFRRETISEAVAGGFASDTSCSLASSLTIEFYWAEIF